MSGWREHASITALYLDTTKDEAEAQLARHLTLRGNRSLLLFLNIDVEIKFAVNNKLLILCMDSVIDIIVLKAFEPILKLQTNAKKKKPAKNAIWE